MNKQAQARAIECQQWAEHYAKQAAIYRQYAADHDGCTYRKKALHYQHIAQITAATARTIITD